MIFILADKLLEEMQINVDLQCNYDDIKHIIDNLEPKLYVNDDFLKTHYAKINTRPQGEWIITQDEKFYHYKCPFCRFWAEGDFLRTNGNLVLPNFCERCGADLRGERK